MAFHAQSAEKDICKREPRRRIKPHKFMKNFIKMTGTPKWHWWLWQIPKNLCKTSYKHDASKYASTDEEHKLRNSWEKSVSKRPLMFRQRRNGYDLFKMWIHSLMVVRYAKGTPAIHLSTETTSFVKYFLSEWGYFPAVGWQGWWARAPGRAAGP